MKIYINNLDDYADNIRTEFFKAIADINKKLESQFKTFDKPLIEIKQIPKNLERTNILDALIDDYKRLEDTQERSNRLGKLEGSIKELQSVWEKK